MEEDPCSLQIIDTSGNHDRLFHFFSGSARPLRKIPDPITITVFTWMDNSYKVSFHLQFIPLKAYYGFSAGS